LSAIVTKDDNGVSIREKVNKLESIMRDRPQIDLPVTHHFSKGVYARELFIPKDTVLTGKIHKHTNLNIISQGDMSVLTEDGIKRVKAPFTIVSPAGTKRIAYAHEDTIWTTIHGTEEIDLEKIEHEFVVETDAEYLSFVETLKLEVK